MQNYKKLYQESERERIRLKQKIKKLQEEIRERCQSFFIQMKRRKRKAHNLSYIRHNIHIKIYPQQPQPQPQTQSNNNDDSNTDGIVDNRQRMDSSQVSYYNNIIQGLKERIQNLHTLRSTQIKTIAQNQSTISKLTNDIRMKQLQVGEMAKTNTELKQYVYAFGRIQQCISMKDTLFKYDSSSMVQVRLTNIINHINHTQHIQQSKVKPYSIQSQSESPYKRLTQIQSQQNMQHKQEQEYKQDKQHQQHQQHKQHKQHEHGQKNMKQKDIEVPYIMEQDIKIPNDQYIKRSFVRKKVIKRNLSVFSVRSTRELSQSKKEPFQKLVKMKNKIDSIYTPNKASKDNKQMISSKLQELSKSAIVQRCSQVSRQSDHNAQHNHKQQTDTNYLQTNHINMNNGNVNDGKVTQVVEIETEMPGRSFYSAHIFEKEKGRCYYNSIKK